MEVVSRIADKIRSVCQTVAATTVTAWESFTSSCMSLLGKHTFTAQAMGLPHDSTAQVSLSRHPRTHQDSKHIQALSRAYDVLSWLADAGYIVCHTAYASIYTWATSA